MSSDAVGAWHAHVVVRRTRRPALGTRVSRPVAEPVQRPRYARRRPGRPVRPGGLDRRLPSHPRSRPGRVRGAAVGRAGRKGARGDPASSARTSPANVPASWSSSIPFRKLDGGAQRFPEGGCEFSLDCLGGAEIVRPTGRNALAPTTHVSTRLRTAERARIDSHTALPYVMEACWRATVLGRLELECVLDGGAFDGFGAEPQVVEHTEGYASPNGPGSSSTTATCRPPWSPSTSGCRSGSAKSPKRGRYVADCWNPGPRPWSSGPSLLSMSIEPSPGRSTLDVGREASRRRCRRRRGGPSNPRR